MKINNLVLRNFRKFEHARFQFHPRFSVLVGNNGIGKTTILDALAIMMNTWFQGSRIMTNGGVIRSEDARTILRTKGGQVFRERTGETWLSASAVVGGSEIEWKRDKGDRGGKAKTFVSLGTQLRSQLESGFSPDLPLLLYYGSGRLWATHKDTGIEKPGSQLDAYRYCLDPKSDQIAFEKWFERLTISDLQKKRMSPALEAVKSAVISCIPDASDFFYDVAEGQIMIQRSSEDLQSFDQLSDGYRNMVAMVADIAHRSARLNPHLERDAAKMTQGVVLIDEIDLHLHPKWQRHVVSDLKTAFPNLQFIATTHSPFILQSMDPGQVIDLDLSPSIQEVEQVPAGIAAPGPTCAFSNRSIEDIVEGIMNINLPQRSERYRAMHEAAKAYYQLLECAQSADESEKAHLKERLDELSAPFSDNIAYHAFLEMERLAAGIK